MTALLIATLIVIVIGVIFLIYFFVTGDSREDVIDVELSPEISSSSLKFENLCIIPGESCEYEIELSHKVRADYEIKLSFVGENKELALKNYVYAKITAGEEVICDALLKDILDGDPLTFTRSLSKKKSETVKIVYYMPSDVGNEAKNTEANFELIISADNSGGLYE